MNHYLKILFVLPFLKFFAFFKAAPAASGSFQARGQIRAAATGLYHSHSNTGSKPCL